MKPFLLSAPLFRLAALLAFISGCSTALGQLHWVYWPGVEYYADAVQLEYSLDIQDKEMPSGTYGVRICSNGATKQWIQFTVYDDHTASGLYLWYPNDPFVRLSDGAIAISVDSALYSGINGHVVGGSVDGSGGAWTWTQLPCCPSSSVTYVPIVLHVSASSTCPPPAGAAGLVSANTKSLDVQVGLGKGTDFRSAGALQIRAGAPFAALSTPGALIPPSIPSTVLTDVNGLRQILSGQILANVLTNNSYQYHIDLYMSSDAGSPGSDGFYHPSVSPFKTVTIQNPDASPTNYNRLWISEVEGSTSNLFAFAYDPTNSAWELDAPNSLQKKVLTTTCNSDLSLRTDLLSVYTPGSPDVLAYQEQKVYQGVSTAFLLQQVLDPNGLKLTNTWAYYSNGQLKQKTQWDGYWETYAYDSQQREIKRVCAFGNATNGSPDALCRVITNLYSITPPNFTTIEMLLGQEVSRTYTALYDASNCVATYRCQTPGATWNNAGNLVSFVVRNSDLQPLISQQPDKTTTFYSYVTNADHSIVTTSTNGVMNASGNGISEGTKNIIVTGPFGETVSNIVMNFTGGAEGALLALDGYSYSSSDYARNSPTVTHMDGTVTLESNGCCGNPSLGNTVDKDGTTTYYVYDALKRRVSTSVNGVTSSNIFDAYGNSVSTMRIGTDASLITNRQASFDLADRLTTDTNALGSGTTYSYAIDSQGQLVKTAMFPDGSTRIETRFGDGSMKSITGTAAFPVQWVYGADSNGTFTLEIKLDANGGTNEWTKTYKDMLGRQYMQVYSGLSNSPVAISYFNAMGQLTNQIDPDGVSTLFAYNGKGEQAYAALDWDQNHIIDFSGNDRITFTTNDVVSDHSTNVRRTQLYSWAQNGLAAPNLIFTTEISTDGLRSWNTLWNNGVGVTSQNILVYAGSGNRYQTNIMPDSSCTVNAFQYGRLASATRYDSGGAQIGQTSYGYDAQGRQNTVTDARTGTTTFFFNNADQPSGVITAAPASGQSPEATTNYFDSVGRLVATTLPDNTSVTNVFNAQGLLTMTYGSRVYAAGYGYDAQGRMKFMTNWSDFTGKNGARVTTWNYDPYRGFLTGKSYDNGNSAGPSYSYTPAGRLLTRAWARGITTSYSLNPAGEIASVAYSDGTTPGISYGYDRRGRQSSITNGASICTLTLNDAGNVLVEAYSGGPLNGISITNGYDGLLRRTRNATLSGSTLLTLVNEAYDAASRPVTISDGINAANYGYIANSPLVCEISFSNYNTLRMVTTKSPCLPPWM